MAKLKIHNYNVYPIGSDQVIATTLRDTMEEAIEALTGVIFGDFMISEDGGEKFPVTLEGEGDE